MTSWFLFPYILQIEDFLEGDSAKVKAKFYFLQNLNTLAINSHTVKKKKKLWLAFEALKEFICRNLRHLLIPLKSKGNCIEAQKSKPKLS